MFFASGYIFLTIYKRRVIEIEDRIACVITCSVNGHSLGYNGYYNVVCTLR